MKNILDSKNPLGVDLTTFVGVPMYADIFKSISIAKAILSKDAQLVTVLSFMMAATFKT